MASTVAFSIRLKTSNALRIVSFLKARGKHPGSVGVAARMILDALAEETLKDVKIPKDDKAQQAELKRLLIKQPKITFDKESLLKGIKLANDPVDPDTDHTGLIVED